MKNFKYMFLLFLVFSTGSEMSGQLFVKDSYVYVADKSIYVTQDINLNTANSFIYLRNDAQILQGTTGAGANAGLGSTSVYQEGTSNAFAYNYWSSPVGGSNATVGNSNFGIVQLGAPTSSTNTTFTAPGPISGFPNGQATNGTLQIASRWIYTFISSLNYSDWTAVGSASTIPPGYGFTMKGTSGTDATTGTTVAAGSAINNNPGSAQRYDFRGKPNDGNISATVATGKLTLVGNPYPSALNMELFLNGNPNCDGTALYWEQPNAGSTSHVLANYQGGYGIYTASSNIYTPAPIYAYNATGTQIGSVLATGTAFKRKFAPVGQGFMVMGTALGNVTFRNTYRAERKENNTDSQFNRTNLDNQTQSYPNYPAIPNVAGIDYTQISTAPAPHILVNGLLNNTGIRQIALVFMPNALDGYDRADAKSPDATDSDLPFDIYLAMNNTEFVQSAKPFAMNQTFQLGFKNNAAATFRLQVAGFVNFNSTNNVYLHDKVTNQYYDIKNASYEFSLPTGVNNTRYEITFQTNLSTDPVSVLSTLNVYHNDTNNTVTIKNPKKINLKSCTLYDIAGKAIFTENNLGSNDFYSYSTLNLSDGIYIVKLTSEDGEDTSKKIAVFNTK